MNTFQKICDSTLPPLAAVQALSDGDLQALMDHLAPYQDGQSIAALVHALATIDAAARWQALGTQPAPTQVNKPWPT